MRVFIAMELPQKTRENLCRSMQQLADHATRGSFTAPQNLHVTLHFLGEVLPENLIYVQSAMDSIKDLPAPTLAISQISTLRASDVVCAKLKYDQKLLDVHTTLGNNLEENGFVTCETQNAKRYKSPLLLTDKGLDAGKKISYKINAVLDAISGGLSDEERVAFYRSLSIISQSLEAVSKGGER